MFWLDLDPADGGVLDLYCCWGKGGTGRKPAGGASPLCGPANHAARRRWHRWVPAEGRGPARWGTPRRSRSSPSQSEQNQAEHKPDPAEAAECGGFWAVPLTLVLSCRSPSHSSLTDTWPRPHTNPLRYPTTNRRDQTADHTLRRLWICWVTSSLTFLKTSSLQREQTGYYIFIHAGSLRVLPRLLDNKSTTKTVDTLYYKESDCSKNEVNLWAFSAMKNTLYIWVRESKTLSFVESSS